MRNVIFWGATGQAKVLHEALAGSDLKLVALIDNRSIPSPLPEVPVFVGETGLDDLLSQSGGARGLCYCVAVGGWRGRDRLQLMSSLDKRGLTAVTIVHRRAFVADDAVLGNGCQILAQSAVCTHARLGRGVIVNTAASVDHDCRLGDGVHIAPGARVAGEVSIGDYSFVGTGAVIAPRISIGSDVIVGAGAVVIKDIPSGVTIVGNPARIVKPNGREMNNSNISS